MLLNYIYTFYRLENWDNQTREKMIYVCDIHQVNFS